MPQLFVKPDAKGFTQLPEASYMEVSQMSYGNFEYEQKTKIVFGKGATGEVGTLAGRYGAKKVLVTTGGNSAKMSGLLDKVISSLRHEGIDFHVYSGCSPNPRKNWVDKGAEVYLDEKCDFLLAVGGGSVIDASKAIAMLASNPRENGIWHYVSGNGKFEKEGKPLGVVLTVGATGSESNGSFVISNEETMEKLICTHESANPVFSICDPENTYSLDKWQTACSISDIISHVLEQYLHSDSTVDVSDNMSIGIIKAVMKWGPVALNEPENYDARANLMWASSIAMNGILGAGHEQNWITHMLEHAVSAVFDVSHGAGLACLTPYYLEYLKPMDAPGRIEKLGRVLFGIQDDADKTIAEFQNFFHSIGMPTRLGELIKDGNDSGIGYGTKEEIIDILAEKSFPWGAMAAGGYGEFGVEDAKDVFLKAW